MCGRGYGRECKGEQVYGEGKYVSRCVGVQYERTWGL